MPDAHHQLSTSKNLDPRRLWRWLRVAPRTARPQGTFCDPQIPQWFPKTAQPTEAGGFEMCSTMKICPVVKTAFFTLTKIG